MISCRLRHELRTARIFKRLLFRLIAQLMTYHYSEPPYNVRCTKNSLIKTRLTLNPHHKLTTSRHNREVLPTVPISTANSVSAVLGMPFRIPTAPLGMTEVLLQTQLHCGLADCSQCTSGTLLGTYGERQGTLGNAILAPRCWPYTCNYLGYKAAGVELGNAGLHSLLSLY